MKRQYLLILMLGLVACFWYGLGYLIDTSIDVDIPVIGWLIGGVEPLSFLSPYSGLVVGLFAVFVYYWLSKGDRS